MSASILAGVRVLSIAEQYPGPYASLVLADLGADVVQVERPGGDPSRIFGGFYDALNRNKRSVVLDLKTADGAAAFLELAATADVVLEGFRPGTVDRLDIGYDQIAERNPRIVYVSISGYGQDGPRRNHPNHDIGYQATAGMLFECARSGVGGNAPAVQVGDLAAGVFAFGATLLGLLHRERTGDGLYVDVAMLDVLVSMMTTALSMVANDSGSPTFLLDGPGYRSYAASDGRLLALGVAHEDKFWQALCKAVGLERYADMPHVERVVRRDELVDRLTEVIASQPRQAWLELLTAAGVPCAPLYDLADVLNDDQVRARDLVVSLPAAEGGERRYIRQPLRPFGFAHAPRAGTPRLGEHTDVILREWTRERP